MALRSDVLTHGSVGKRTLKPSRGRRQPGAGCGSFREGGASLRVRDARILRTAKKKILPVNSQPC